MPTPEGRALEVFFTVLIVRTVGSRLPRKKVGMSRALCLSSLCEMAHSWNGTRSASAWFEPDWGVLVAGVADHRAQQRSLAKVTPPVPTPRGWGAVSPFFGDL